jgi:hypothetical protein
MSSDEVVLCPTGLLGAVRPARSRLRRLTSGVAIGEAAGSEHDAHARGNTMSMKDSEDDEVGGVESDVQYILPTSRINRRYLSPAGQINVSEYASQRVFIRNARPIADQITFESHGFTLRRRSSAVKDFRNTEQIDRVYVPEFGIDLHI